MGFKDLERKKQERRRFLPFAVHYVISKVVRLLPAWLICQSKNMENFGHKF
jgi:hypothetical protein